MIRNVRLNYVTNLSIYGNTKEILHIPTLKNNKRKIKFGTDLFLFLSVWIFADHKFHHLDT